MEDDRDEARKKSHQSDEDDAEETDDDTGALRLGGNPLAKEEEIEPDIGND